MDLRDAETWGSGFDPRVARINLNPHPLPGDSAIPQVPEGTPVVRLARRLPVRFRHTVAAAARPGFTPSRPGCSTRFLADPSVPPVNRSDGVHRVAVLSVSPGHPLGGAIVPSPSVLARYVTMALRSRTRFRCTACGGSFSERRRPRRSRSSSPGPAPDSTRAALLAAPRAPARPIRQPPPTGSRTAPLTALPRRIDVDGRPGFPREPSAISCVSGGTIFRFFTRSGRGRFRRPPHPAAPRRSPGRQRRA